MAAEILGGVLPLPVRVVGRQVQDAGAVPRSLLVLRIRVLDTYGKDRRRGERLAIVPVMLPTRFAGPAAGPSCCRRDR